MRDIYFILFFCPIQFLDQPPPYYCQSFSLRIKPPLFLYLNIFRFCAERNVCCSATFYLFIYKKKKSFDAETKTGLNYPTLPPCGRDLTLQVNKQGMTTIR